MILQLAFYQIFVPSFQYIQLETVTFSLVRAGILGRSIELLVPLKTNAPLPLIVCVVKVALLFVPLLHCGE